MAKVVGSTEELPEPIQMCLDKPVMIDLVDCFNAANYAEFIKVPLLAIQSTVDAYSLQHIVVATCLKNKKPPYSLDDCTEDVMKAIEDYRQESLYFLNKMKKEKKDLGVWGPVCVQHGFSAGGSFTNDSYKVKDVKLVDAVSAFVEDETALNWLVDEGPWPENRGCSG